MPNDPQSPFITSGIRLGTPAVTTRGLGVDEMDVIAECIKDTVDTPIESREECRKKVAQICERFPLYSFYK